jgi:lipid-A-disaccharide synthase
MNLPWFLQAALAVRRNVPAARFAVASFKPRQADIARHMVAAAGIDAEVFVGRTPELIQAATCCLACSGSVSLELLHHAKPTVIGYRISRLTNVARRILLNVPYITLVNLLSTGRTESDRRTERASPSSNDPRVLFPEFLGQGDYSAEAAEHLVRWLTDDAARAASIAALETLRDEVGRPGASDRAAEYVLSVGGKRSSQPAESAVEPVPRPHYLPAAAPSTISAHAAS